MGLLYEPLATQSPRAGHATDVSVENANGVGKPEGTDAPDGNAMVCPGCQTPLDSLVVAGN